MWPFKTKSTAKIQEPSVPTWAPKFTYNYFAPVLEERFTWFDMGWPGFPHKDFEKVPQFRYGTQQDAYDFLKVVDSVYKKYHERDYPVMYTDRLNELIEYSKPLWVAFYKISECLEAEHYNLLYDMKDSFGKLETLWRKFYYDLIEYCEVDPQGAYREMLDSLTQFRSVEHNAMLESSNALHSDNKNILQRIYK